MAKEHETSEVTAFDIAHSPTVRELAEEVARTRVSKSLLDGDREIAKIVPSRKRVKHKGIDPAKLTAALEKLGEAMGDVDPDELIADIYRAREEGSRPANRP